MCRSSRQCIKSFNTLRCTWVRSFSLRRRRFRARSSSTRTPAEQRSRSGGMRRAPAARCQPWVGAASCHPEERSDEGSAFYRSAAMDAYNFTERVRTVLRMAREEAIWLHHEYLGTEHMLLGLVREGKGVAATVLQNLSVELDQIHQNVIETVKGGKAAQITGPDLPYTSRAKKVLELSMSEARELNHKYVGTEHLLLGLLREQKGIAAQVLIDAGVNFEAARAETLRILGTEMPQGGATAQQGSGAPQTAQPKGEKKSKTPALDHFCRDLTQLAAEGQLDPTIGRAKEIQW